MVSFIKLILPSGIKIQLKKIKRQIDIKTHKGDKYHCAFCGFNADKLALIGLDFPVLKVKDVIGAGKREAGCYYCGSTDRERLVYTYLMEVFDLEKHKENLSVLHIAPEKNLTTALLNSGLKKYVCGDLFTEGYEYPAHVENINILEIPYPEESFDLVICNHVMEHIPEDKKAMTELYRVLKTGGFAILQVPVSDNSATTIEDLKITDPKVREQLFGQFDHVRIYGHDYVDRLQNCGFKTEQLNISRDYPKYGLNPREILYICRK